MRQIYHLLLLTAIILMAVVPYKVLGQSSRNGSVSSVPSDKISTMSDRWMSERWTANEVPFVLARKDMERSLRAKHDPREIAQKYEALAVKNPKDAITVFRWGMAVFSDIPREPITWHPTSVDHLLSILAVFPSPHSMQFARMRFLIETHFLGDAHLKIIGARLLNHDPQDDAVKGSMIRLLNTLTSLGETQLALKYAHQLVAKHPTDPNEYRKLGGVYNNLVLLTKKRSDVQNAITAYQTYQKYASKSDPWYSTSEYFIKFLQKFLREDTMLK